MVALQVVKYWDMAPIKTVKNPSIETRIVRLVYEHDARRKNQSRKTATEVKMRDDFKESLKRLFDIASVDAEKEIEKNRFLVKRNKNGEVITKDR